MQLFNKTSLIHHYFLNTYFLFISLLFFFHDYSIAIQGKLERSILFQSSNQIIQPVAVYSLIAFYLKMYKLKIIAFGIWLFQRNRHHSLNNMLQSWFSLQKSSSLQGYSRKISRKADFKLYSNDRSQWHHYYLLFIQQIIADSIHRWMSRTKDKCTLFFYYIWN